MKSPYDDVVDDILASEQHIKSYEQVPWTERFAGRTTYDLINAAARWYGGDAAIEFLTEGRRDEPTLTLTYQALAAQVTQTANALHTLGIDRRDAVSVLLPNLPESHGVIWGCQAAGICNPLNPLLEAEHLLHIVRSVGARGLIAPAPEADPALWHKVERLLAEVEGLEFLLLIDAPGTKARSADAVRGGIPCYNYHSAIAREAADQLRCEQPPQAGDIAACFHTGGTTGRPKIARLRHSGFAFVAQLLGALTAWKGRYTLLMTLPLFHIYGLISAGIANLLTGRRMILMTSAGFRSPDVRQHWWHHVERFQARAFPSVPTMLGRLLDLPAGDVDLSCLREVGSGAAPLPAHVRRSFEARFGVSVRNGYGMTESSCILTVNVAPQPAPDGSVGRRLPYTELRFARIDGRHSTRDCAPGEVGVLLARGPHVFAGYLDAPDNAQAWIDGDWLNTGDVGYMDAAGCVFLTGRAKDLIIRGGHNIDPVLIEAPLMAHPDVALAVAVGQPDAHSGEVPVAFVHLKPDARVTPQALLEYCRDHVTERAAIPKRIELVDAIPLTAVGKIFRPALRALAAGHVIRTLLDAAGIEAQIQVDPDDRLGLRARIRLVDHGQLAAAEDCLARLPLCIEVSGADAGAACVA